MAHALRRLNRSDLLNETPNLAACVARGEARPAFKRAFEAQLEVFTGAISNPGAARLIACCPWRWCET
jgi:glutathione S-transferase